ncbi:MAG: hypothetical protein LBV67_04620 [Streptococcaceae bacterium]|jgi:hypothetical protein|nr:hypothetical protein [Streptococcaceae bacterium]
MERIELPNVITGLTRSKVIPEEPVFAKNDSTTNEELLKELIALKQLVLQQNQTIENLTEEIQEFKGEMTHAN